MGEQKKTTPDSHLSPEVLVPRLGDYLVGIGHLSPQQLEQALKYQQLKQSQHIQLRLGQALRELNLIDEHTLEEAITVQILQLQQALKQANQELERRVVERTNELRKALDQVTELNQVKANFIANISHELRTPLTLMKGYLDIIADQGLGPVTKEQSEALTLMSQAEVRLEKLIDDMIQFSYVEQGELTLKLGVVNIHQVIKVAVDHVIAKAEMAEVSLKHLKPKPLPSVHCDRGQIVWVVEELLNNAIKFTPRQGMVRVEALQHANSVVVAVTDSGIGIPTNHIQEIFEPFHQLDGSSTRRYGGTGLGLAMSKRIIEAHGSRFKVLSKLGKGSRFEFALPVESAQQQQQE